jgi:hypothetical protein
MDSTSNNESSTTTEKTTFTSISTRVKSITPVPKEQLPMNTKDQQFIFSNEKVRVGLRWTCTAPKTADLDLSCILLDEYANIANGKFHIYIYTL